MLALFVLLACEQREPGQDTDIVTYVDVRSPEEFATGHMPGALNIPVEEIEQRWRELEPFRQGRIVVYCRTGRRSARAIEFLTQRGFTRLENGGGFEELRNRDL